jgi:hypothetical protein
MLCCKNINLLARLQIIKVPRYAGNIKHELLLEGDLKNAQSYS